MVFGHVLNNFPDNLEYYYYILDILPEVGNLCLQGEVNVIKLPFIKSVVPQYKECIAEV